MTVSKRQWLRGGKPEGPERSLRGGKGSQQVQAFVGVKKLRKENVLPLLQPKRRGRGNKRGRFEK